MSRFVLVYRGHLDGSKFSSRFIVGSHDILCGVSQFRQRGSGLKERGPNAKSCYSGRQPFCEICRPRATDGVHRRVRRQHRTHRLHAGRSDRGAWENLQSVGARFQRRKTFRWCQNARPRRQFRRLGFPDDIDVETLGHSYDSLIILPQAPRAGATHCDSQADQGLFDGPKRQKAAREGTPITPQPMKNRA